MRRLAHTFARLRRERRAAFIPFLMAGDPRPAWTVPLAETLIASGADVLELGMPFSDPLADGPTIQRAAARALARHITVARVLRMVAQLRRRWQGPVVLLSYYNPLAQYGRGRTEERRLRAFARDAVRAGVDGVVVPDVPPEEMQPLARAARARHLDMILLAAPTSSPERLRRIARWSRGFIYLVSLTGTTGARRRLPSDVAVQARRLQRLTQTPVCVGFGIANPSEARRMAQIADGVIVGSALVQLVGQGGSRSQTARRLHRTAVRLRRAIDG